MKCVLLGGSGEVGRAVARALVASDVCSKLTMIGRRSVDDLAGDEIEQVVTDTSADDFESVVERAARGHDVAISCIGTGSGTASVHPLPSMCPGRPSSAWLWSTRWSPT